MGTPSLRRIILPALVAVFFVAGCRVALTPVPTIAPSSTPLPTHTTTPTATNTATSTPLPTTTPIPLPTLEGCPNTESSLIDLQIPSELLGEPLLYRVYLPPCFSENPARPYPVLYLLHGQQQDATLWERLGALDLADRVAFSESLRPFIIVMPTERRFLVDLQETNYAPAVAEELIPAVDAAFPTCKEKSCRAIGGISRGGAWAVRIGFLYPDLFGYIGAHSPAVFGADLNRLPVTLKNSKPDEIPFTYIDTGRSDNYRESAIKLENVLTDFGALHEWHLNEGQHEISYWQEHIAEYIAWYSQNWR